MHEFSLMQSTLEIAAQQMHDAGATHLHRLKLRVGKLSGVVPEALRFAFESLKPKSFADDTKLEIEETPAICWCPTCAAQQQVLDKLKDKPEFAKLTIFKVDFDNQPDVVRSFGARTQSTLIAYKGATETGRSAGDTNAASIESLLKSALK